MQAKKHILLVEDDDHLAYALTRQLEQLGFEMTTATNGNAGLEAVLNTSYDLLIIDIGLPGVSGLEIVTKMRKHNIKAPAIIITSQLSSESERTSFIKGANLFHGKPIDIELLKAQINSLLQQYQPKAIMEAGDLYLDVAKRAVFKEGQQIKLSYKEFELVRLLIECKGEVLTRDDIIRSTYKGVNDPQDGSIDTLVSRTRKKLGEYKDEPVIETVHGVGFRLNSSYFVE